MPSSRACPPVPGGGWRRVRFRIRMCACVLPGRCHSWNCAPDVAPRVWVVASAASVELVETTLPRPADRRTWADRPIVGRAERTVTGPAGSGEPEQLFRTHNSTAMETAWSKPARLVEFFPSWARMPSSPARGQMPSSPARSQIAVHSCRTSNAVLSGWISRLPGVDGWRRTSIPRPKPALTRGPGGATHELRTKSADRPPYGRAKRNSRVHKWPGEPELPSRTRISRAGWRMPGPGGAAGVRGPVRSRPRPGPRRDSGRSAIRWRVRTRPPGPARTMTTDGGPAHRRFGGRALAGRARVGRAPTPDAATERGPGSDDPRAAPQRRLIRSFGTDRSGTDRAHRSRAPAGPDTCRTRGSASSSTPWALCAGVRAELRPQAAGGRSGPGAPATTSSARRPGHQPPGAWRRRRGRAGRA